MATRIWTALARLVAQISSVTITAYDAATTYSLRVGGVTIASAIGGGTVTAVAAALVSAWNGSTHAYRTGITLSNAAGVITATGTAGIPFTLTAGVSGGAGTVGAVSTPTAAVSPYHFNAAENWSGQAVPVSGDVLIFADSDVPLLWALDQSALDNLTVEIKQTYTGRIGLHRGEFAISANGETVVDTVPEYRTTYLRAGMATVRIGEHDGVAEPAGAARVKLDNTRAGASLTTVYRTAPVGRDAGLPAVRLLAAHALAVLEVRSAQGAVAVAADEPGETSTFGTIRISDETEVSRVLTGDGLTLTTWTQQGGRNRLQSAAAVTTVTVNGGELELNGQQGVTTLNVNGGAVFAENVPSSGAALTTVNLNGGTLDGLGASDARTWSTVNFNLGTLRLDGAAVTITTWNEAAGVRTYQAA
ncbi:MAG: hypothetical protein K2Y51_09280 [Gammaproteobacteria bacterium]|nr:hypothetical protein [Gammaproteobacteria bacterium]